MDWGLVGLRETDEKFELHRILPSTRCVSWRGLCGSGEVDAVSPEEWRVQPERDGTGEGEVAQGTVDFYAVNLIPIDAWYIIPYDAWG